jgi:hypothetical protein
MRALLLLLILSVGSAPSFAQQPTLDEINVDYGNGDYRNASRKIDKLLFPSTQDKVSPQRYELLMLKGECALQLKDRIGAGSAFKSAAKAAGDVSQLAAARANELIVDKSSSGRYMPRIGSGLEPIDILPLESRKQAMLELKAELWSQNKSRIDAALRGDKLPPIEEVFTRVADMFALESFATGQPTETEKMMRELGGHAFRLMQAEVSRSSRRVDQLNQIANSSSDTALGWNSGRLGLTSQQRDELKAMLPYLGKIRDRATEYRRIAAKLGGDEQKWDALVADSTDTIFDAESLFNDR